MSKLQLKAYDSLKHNYCLPYNPVFIDVKKIFRKEQPVVVEIGFGMGITTAEIAAGAPALNYLGIEVHTPGVGKLLSEIEKNSLENVRIIQHDAAEVLKSMIPDHSIEGFHIFFPDPWPKKKHHKRRLIQDTFVSLLTEKLKPSGYIYIVTDWEEYALHIINCISGNSKLRYPVSESSVQKPWRPKTKFEVKGLSKGHRITEIFAVSDS